MELPTSAPPVISVIVATFNEEATVERCVRRILAVYPHDCEVLVVDGGSDGTGDIVRKLCEELPGLRYIRNENDRGKGHATKVGIAAARADIMVEIDADLQFLPEEIPRLVEPIRSGKADVVLGSRFMPGSQRLPGSTTWLRTFGNKTTSLYASVLFFQLMTDVLAGMMAWNRRTVQTFDVRSDNYSYEVEIPVKALRHGLKVLDVPVTTDARQGGVSCVNVVIDGITLLIDITRFRLGLK